MNFENHKYDIHMESITRKIVQKREQNGWRPDLRGRALHYQQ
jgi:hypothetical protein